ncbi:MAG: HAD family hydrolase [Spirochaetota bacterium]
MIWDLDGVLLDNELQHIDAELQTFEKFGLQVPRETAEQYMGIRLEDYFRAIARRYWVRAPVDVMTRAHLGTLRRYYGEAFPLTPHADRVLEELGASRVQALATNRERELALLALERFGLLGRFQAAVYGDEVVRGKPDPEIYLKAASLLGVEPSACTVIEDSVNGLAAAKGAGMRVIIRLGGHNRHVDFTGADQVVDDLREIPAILRR